MKNVLYTLLVILLPIVIYLNITDTSLGIRVASLISLCYVFYVIGLISLSLLVGCCQVKSGTDYVPPSHLTAEKDSISPSVPVAKAETDYGNSR